MPRQNDESKKLLQKRNDAIRAEFKTLSKEKRLAYDYCLELLKDKFYLAKKTLENMLKDKQPDTKDKTK